MDLYSIEYLKQGSARQQRAYGALRSLEIFERLDSAKTEPYGGGDLPALAGSLPIDLALDDSDLDIITSASDLKLFSSFLKTEFGSMAEFRSQRGIILGVATLITSFKFENESFEIFTQNLPVPMQNAVAHMLIEERLLILGGAKFREKLMELRRSGLKTEPAFGEVLGLNDPYRELLELETFTDNELRARFGSALK